METTNRLSEHGYAYPATSDWALDFPTANGSNQSPINLMSTDAEYDESLLYNPICLNYAISRETELVNNGKTVIVYPRAKPGFGLKSEAEQKSILSGGPLPVGHEYELAEVRFHWGREDSRGSEHTVNFKAFPMEIHLIHWNTTQYSSLDDALEKKHGVAIVAVFIQVGREQSALNSITESLEDVQYRGRQKVFTSGFNLNSFLPDPMLRDYWTYNGSLTSPPCYEKVTWVLLRYPLTMSHSQLENFRRLRTHQKGVAPQQGEDGAMVDNFRPCQALMGRKIRASFQ